MRVCVLMGSPRLAGNTAVLTDAVVQRLRERGAEVDCIPLAERSIAPCRGCYVCQQVSGIYGCAQTDDMDEIVASIRACDCLLLATPIYSWYCTAEMKAVLDRLYGMNKFYGSGEGTLWSGQRVALLTTHGYDADYAASPFETGIRRYCAHSRLRYCGMYSVRDDNGRASFTTPSAIHGAQAFADALLR